MGQVTDPVDRSVHLKPERPAPLGPYLLFLGDTVERGYAKTAFGLRDWAPDLCVGEFALPDATVTLDLPKLTPAEAIDCGARSLVIGVANTGGFIAEAWVPALVEALESGLDIVSGMHAKLGQIAELRYTAERLGRRLVDVRTASSKILQDAVGSNADWLRRLAEGIDDRLVEPNQPAKSSGTENTFAEDLTDGGEIRKEIDEMARGGAAWLERKMLFCRTVTIKVRYSDFTTITRSHSSDPPTRDANDIASRAIALVDKTEAGYRPVRLLGVSVHNLVDPSEKREEIRLPLFDEVEGGDGAV